MPEAYLFDLDGTLIDSEPMWAAALERSLVEIACPLTAAEVHALVYGRSWLDVHVDLCRRFPGRCEDRGVLEGRLDHHFEVLKCNGSVRIESSISLLIRLAAKRPVAIVSGSGRRTVGEWVEELGLGSYLRFFLGCDDYPVGKPDPACYLLAAARLGVAPAACLVFEDSRAGVLAAKAAGMSCIALQRCGAAIQDLSAADRIVGDLSEYGRRRRGSGRSARLRPGARRNCTPCRPPRRPCWKRPGSGPGGLRIGPSPTRTWSALSWRQRRAV